MARDEVRELIRDLRDVPRDERRFVRAAILRSGHDLLQRVRRNASWSTRIPGATRLSVRFSRSPGVDVITDSQRAPHASVYEGDGRPGRFRHPLFGNRSHWYSQRRRPFQGPAMDAEAPHAVAAIADAVDQAFWNARFR